MLTSGWLSFVCSFPCETLGSKAEYVTSSACCFTFYYTTLFYIFNLLKTILSLHYKSNSSEGCWSLGEYQTWKRQCNICQWHPYSPSFTWESFLVNISKKNISIDEDILNVDFLCHKQHIFSIKQIFVIWIKCNSLKVAFFPCLF